MKSLDIEAVFNVPYHFQYQPCERLFAMYKQYFRKRLLDEMLKDPSPKDTPLNDALHDTFNARFHQAQLSIPRFIKKALKLLRRHANEIRKENGEEELESLD